MADISSDDGFDIDLSKILSQRELEGLKYLSSKDFRKEVMRGVKDSLLEELSEEATDLIMEQIDDKLNEQVDKLYKKIQAIPSKTEILVDNSPKIEEKVSAPVTVTVEQPPVPASVEPEKAAVTKTDKINTALDAIDAEVKNAATSDDIQDIIDVVEAEPLEIPKLSLIERGFIGARKLREKVLGPKLSTEEQAQTRQGLIRLGNQMIMTQKIIESNSEILKEVAVGNKDVAKVLATSSSETSKTIREKLVTGKELFPEEAKYLVQEMELITKGLKDVGVALEVNMPEMIGKFRELISDNRLDLETRRGLLENLSDVVKESTKDKETLALIKSINTEQLNFTKDQLDVLNGVFDQLADKTKDIKVNKTLTDLNRTMDSLVLTDEEVAKFLGEKGEDGKTKKESLLAKGLGAIPEAGAGRGVLDTLLAVAGLPGGLSEIAEIYKLYAGTKGAVKGAVTGIKTIYGKVAESRVGKAIGGSVVGKTAGAVTGIGRMGVESVRTGVGMAVTKTAGAVTGIGRMGIESAKTGATMVASKTVSAVSDVVGTGASLVSKAIPAILTTVETITAAGATFASTILTAVAPILLFVAGVTAAYMFFKQFKVLGDVGSSIGSALYDFFNPKSEVGLTTTKEDIEKARAEGKLPALPTTGVELVSKSEAEEKAVRTGAITRTASKQTSTVNQPTGSANRPSNRTQVIDDLGLHLINSNMLD